MADKLPAFLRSEKGRYIYVGVSVYIFELIVIELASWSGMSSVVSVALSFWFGLILSFFLQKLITFQDKRMHHKVLLPQIIAVTVLVLFNFGFTLLVTKLLSDSITAFGSRTLALGATTIWNFYIYRTRIFKNAPNPEIG